MSWEYFRPENHGLVGVGEVDWYGGTGCYEWDTTTVMYHPETDRFYWEHGSGCSCNGPLEEVSGLDDLQSGTLWELNDALARDLTAIPDYRKSDKEFESISADFVDLMSAALKVREARNV